LYLNPKEKRTPITPTQISILETKITQMPNKLLDYKYFGFLTSLICFLIPLGWEFRAELTRGLPIIAGVVILVTLLLKNFQSNKVK
jgi:hypothetical protein